MSKQPRQNVGEGAATELWLPECQEACPVWRGQDVLGLASRWQQTPRCRASWQQLRRLGQGLLSQGSEARVRVWGRPCGAGWAVHGQSHMDEHAGRAKARVPQCPGAEASG